MGQLRINNNRHFKEKGSKFLNWIHLTQDGEQWRTLLNMTYRFHKSQEISWTAKRLLAFQEWLYSMYLFKSMIRGIASDLTREGPRTRILVHLKERKICFVCPPDDLRLLAACTSNTCHDEVYTLQSTANWCYQIPVLLNHCWYGRHIHWTLTKCIFEFGGTGTAVCKPSARTLWVSEQLGPSSWQNEMREGRRTDTQCGIFLPVMFNSQHNGRMLQNTAILGTPYIKCMKLTYNAERVSLRMISPPMIIYWFGRNSVLGIYTKSFNFFIFINISLI